MKTLRLLLSLGALSLALVGAACGGGSGGGGDSGASASLAGTVLTNDGTTNDLDGLRFRLGNTGEVVTTRPDGSFDFGSVPIGTVTVQLVGHNAAIAGSMEDDDDEEGDDEDEADDDDDDDQDEDDDDGEDADDGDDDDTGDDDFDVEDLEDGEQVFVRIRVEDGEIVSVEISRSHHARLRVDVELQRSDESDDPDVEGDLRIESRDDRQRFKVEAEDLDPGREVELFVIDPDGNEESLGVRTAGVDEDDDEGEDDDGDDGDDDDEEDGEAEWKLDTKKGDELPFGVDSVEDLLGFSVEVRDANDGTLLLFGTIPELPDPLVEFPDDDDDELHGRAALVAEAGVAGMAFVELESEEEDDELEQEFEVEVDDLDLAAGTELEVFLEDAGGTMVSIGTLMVDDEGDGELEFETEDGDALPFDVASIEELVGRGVEIRLLGDGTLLFSGEVPTLVGDDDDGGDDEHDDDEEGDD